MISPNKDLTKRILQWGNSVNALALTGLNFCSEPHEKERYEKLLDISCEMMGSIDEDLRYDPALAKEIKRILMKDLKGGVAGYVTPKICVASAVFNKKGCILLVEPNENKGWCLPGGWAEEYCTPAENAEREVKEETNLRVRARSLLGVFDSRLHPFETTVTNYTLLFDCELIGGRLKPLLSEVASVHFFQENELPMLIEGCKRQVGIAFSNWHGNLTTSYFDAQYQ